MIASCTVLTRVVALVFVFALINGTASGQHDSEHEDEEDGFVSLTRQQREEAHIETESIELKRLSTTIILPAEVAVNGYRSARVTPKIPSVVESRHVRLGDVVVAGAPLVSLSSVEMADAAGELMLASYEWRLVRELGREAVSGRRYAEAETAQRKAMARVLAYGLTERHALTLSTSDDLHAFSGRFDLFAPRAGTVFSDDFVVGELVEPGRVLIEIVDESSVWVEARANELPEVERGTFANVLLDSGQVLKGRVIQRHHRLDEATRTQAIRIEVDNVDDMLHPGQFLEVELETGMTEPVLAVRGTAVTLVEGRESVFRLEGNEFHPVEISGGDELGDWVIIKKGLRPGDIVATTGVFYIKSLLLKSSLGSGHAH